MSVNVDVQCWRKQVQVRAQHGSKHWLMFHMSAFYIREIKLAFCSTILKLKTTFNHLMYITRKALNVTYSCLLNLHFCFLLHHYDPFPTVLAHHCENSCVSPGSTTISGLYLGTTSLSQVFSLQDDFSMNLRQSHCFCDYIYIRCCYIWHSDWKWRKIEHGLKPKLACTILFWIIRINNY